MWPLDSGSGCRCCKSSEPPGLGNYTRIRHTDTPTHSLRRKRGRSPCARRNQRYRQERLYRRAQGVSSRGMSWHVVFTRGRHRDAPGMVTLKPEPRITHGAAMFQERGGDTCGNVHLGVDKTRAKHCYFHGLKTAGSAAAAANSPTRAAAAIACDVRSRDTGRVEKTRYVQSGRDKVLAQENHLCIVLGRA